jgi:hemoglobin-like flavoprotein
MNDHTISIVRESFDLLEPIASQAAALYYANLFDAAPSLRRIQEGDAAQCAKLVRTMSLVVARLDEPTELRALLSDSSRGWPRELMLDEYVDAARSALLKTLYESLGVAYTPEVEEAWIEVWAELASLSKDAVLAPAMSA